MIAITENGRSFSYSELDDRIARVAGCLLRRVSPGSAVGITIDNRIESLELLLGAMHAGMRVVPLPGFLPTPARLATMAAGRVRLTIGLGCSTLNPDSAEYEDELRSASPPSQILAGGGIALGTSGTEGRPRLLYHDFARLHAFMNRSVHVYGFTPDTHVYTNAPMAVGAGLIMALVSLAGGGTVILDREPPTAERTAHVMRVTRPNFTVAHPIMLRRWREHGIDADSLASVQTLTSTTSELSLEEQRHFLERYPHIRLINAYAASDVGLVAKKVVTEPTTSLGEIFPDIEVRLADEDDAGIGMIEVRGDSTALSILGLLRDRPLGEWVTAGDYGMLVDGELHLAGRRSDKIIVNGYNVYAGEVEHAARRLPGVVDAAAVGVPDRKRGQNVALFYVGEVSPDAVIQACALYVPRHAVPVSATRLNALPMTPSGKIKKRELV